MLRFRRFLRVLRTTVNPLLDFVLVTWQLVELLHRHGVLWPARLADKRVRQATAARPLLAWQGRFA